MAGRKMCLGSEADAALPRRLFPPPRQWRIKSLHPFEVSIADLGLVVGTAGTVTGLLQNE